MKKGYNTVRRLCAWIIGVVFTLSGIIKVMDPVGAGLVMGEYFQFLHLGFLRFLTKPAGMFFSFLEAITGVALVTGVWRKITAIVASSLMGLFTILTLLLLIFNPTMDCGCFGEALHLTHLQSFLKNIILDLLLVVAFVPFRDFGEPKKIKYGSFGLVTLSIIAFGIFSSLYFPLKDFTGYRPGSKLSSAIKIDEAVDFNAAFIYEKDGIRQVITLEDELPDESWTFIGSEAIAEKDLSSLPVLPVTNEGEVADTLAATGNVMVVSVYRPKHMNGRKKAQLKDFLAMAEGVGFTPLYLTLRPEPGSGEYGSDFRAMAGLNRSNGGVTIIQDGVIIRKWARRHLPSEDLLKELINDEPTETIIGTESHGNLLFQSFLLYVFSILLLL